MGVDSLDEFSVVLLVRIRTIAGKQWVVGRAFNRLVKIAFDKHRIGAPEPASTATAPPLPAPEDTQPMDDAPRQRRRA